MNDKGICFDSLLQNHSKQKQKSLTAGKS